MSKKCNLREINVAGRSIFLLGKLSVSQITYSVKGTRFPTQILLNYHENVNKSLVQAV